MGEQVRTWSTPEPEVSEPLSPARRSVCPSEGKPAGAPGRPSIDVHGQTRIGRGRTRNDDQFLIADLDRWMLIRHSSSADGSRRSWGDQGKLLAVAGGMAGTGCTRATRRATIDSVARYITSTMSWALYNQPPGSDPRAVRERVVDELGHVLPRCWIHLRRLAQERGRATPLGGTITLAYVMWPDMYVVHAGSSRCYLMRAGCLRQLTSGGGPAPASQGGARPLRIPIIERTVGSSDDPRADVHHVSLQSGDRVLLCTEGLTGHLSDQRIASLLRADALRADARASRACHRLIQMATRADCRSDTTVVLARFR